MVLPAIEAFGPHGLALLPGPDEGFFSTSSCHLPRTGKGATGTSR